MPSILVVENNDFFRRSFREILRMYIPSLQVEESADGADVMASISRDLPDMIFMDIRLPGKSGLDLTREIKRSHPEAVVSIFTSYDLPDYRRVAEEYGADHFLLKDAITGAEIAAMVKEAAGRRKKKGEAPQKQALATL
ncbi:MAG: response regulator transcription factor [Syntrophobacteraceae bacterium]